MNAQSLIITISTTDGCAILLMPWACSLTRHPDAGE